MKYSATNKPPVCMMTQSTCYRGTRKMEVKGVLWHSTGVNNPWLKRYVQPDDNAADRAAWLTKLGKNAYNNDWNHIKREAGLNCWIGKFADGTVGTVQTMPWDYRPWGCGSGSKGSCNSGWVQFEMCEDGLTDATYFNQAYKEACEITAYICKMYNIDPHGTVTVNGVKVPTILCHQDSYKLGMGSNHVDVYNWFNKHGKTMDNVRNDVAALLEGTGAGSVVTTKPSAGGSGHSVLRKGSTGDEVKELQQKLTTLGYSLGSIDGDFGNKTLAAVKKFQSDYSLEVDGVVGNQTWNALDKAIAAKASASYVVRLTTDTLNIRKGAGTNYAVVGCIRDRGAYTIVEEKAGTGASKWGLLKAYASGKNGWISLDYVKKV